MIANPTLPDGLFVEDWGDGYQVIFCPSRGGVTIDWRGRAYRLGWSQTGPVASKASYTGRGWQQRLIADAVKQLESV